MFLRNFFKPVPKISVAAVKNFLEKHGEKDYNLVDVRQRAEYQSGHLPGAHLIPMAELSVRMKELDPSKPTITY